jgi:hypothetical protein
VTETLAPAFGAIRNPEKYLEAAQRRRTERFNACFPRGISFGDLDSFVELDNRFLVIEWKLGDQQLGTGQHKALSRLARVPVFTVFVIWTDKDGTITHAQDMSRPHSGRNRATEERVSERIKNWADGISEPVAMPAAMEARHGEIK